jgi:general stress protein YciG
MAGTKAGAQKARETNIAKYGKDFYAKIGAKSWDNPDRSHATGFALLSREKAAELGRKGGQQNKGKKYATTKKNTDEEVGYLSQEGYKSITELSEAWTKALEKTIPTNSTKTQGERSGVSE